MTSFVHSLYKHRICLGVVAVLMLTSSPAWAAAADAGAGGGLAQWAFVAAAAATAISAVAAAYAVARVGSAAVGVLAEKPELFGRTIVLVGLAEGIAIYGLIIAILILNRLG